MVVQTSAAKAKMQNPFAANEHGATRTSKNDFQLRKNVFITLNSRLTVASSVRKERPNLFRQQSWYRGWDRRPPERRDSVPAPHHDSLVYQGFSQDKYGSRPASLDHGRIEWPFQNMFGPPAYCRKAWPRAPE